MDEKVKEQLDTLEQAIGALHKALAGIMATESSATVLLFLNFKDIFEYPFRKPSEIVFPLREHIERERKKAEVLAKLSNEDKRALGFVLNILI